VAWAEVVPVVVVRRRGQTAEIFREQNPHDLVMAWVQR
jgi:hypothetical protein